MRETQEEIGVTPLGLHLRDAFLVALELVVDRLEQRREPLALELFRFGEALVRAVEELRLGVLQRLGGGRAEAGVHFFQREPVRLVARPGLRAPPGQLGAGGIAPFRRRT